MTATATIKTETVTVNTSQFNDEDCIKTVEQFANAPQHGQYIYDVFRVGGQVKWNTREMAIEKAVEFLNTQLKGITQ